jgi:Septum formation initiator
MRDRKKASDRQGLKIFPALMLILLLAGSYILVTQYLEYRKVQDELEKKRLELQQQQEINQKLKEDRVKVMSPEEIEKKAREDLGLVKPGEIPVKTIPAKSEDEKNNP